MFEQLRLRLNEGIEVPHVVRRHEYLCCSGRRRSGPLCDAAKTLCPEGFFCDPVVNKCNEQNGANAECYPQFDSCQPDFRCLTSPTDTTKTTCQPKTGLNQPCSSHEECQTGVCEPRVTGDACSNLIDISTQSPECTFFDGL